MKRVLRHLFTFSAGLSLLLCVYVCMHWVESWMLSSRAWGGVGRLHVRVEHYRGLVEFGVYRNKSDGKSGPPRQPLRTPRVWDLGPLVVEWGHTSNPMSAGIWRGADFVRVQSAHWLLAAPLAVAPGVWLLRRRLARRRRAGCCLACGYDMRASPGRCPECGTPAPA